MAELMQGRKAVAPVLLLDSAAKIAQVPVPERLDLIDESPRLTLVSPAEDESVHFGKLEQRQDWRQRVIFECDQQAVPLPLEYRGSVYVQFLKPAMDRVAAVLLIILMLPLCLCIALAIKLDDGGPVFFKQKRTGYLGRRFELYKFRTMVPDAENLKALLQKLNHHGSDSPDFKVRNDPRVTRLGRILRKTSLDELPNILNVLKGDMSLVGPRPTSFDIRSYRANHYPRLALLPGITGLWQISGRADVDFDERTEMDIRYIRSVSLKQDVGLLIKTMKAVRSGAGAH